MGSKSTYRSEGGGGITPPIDKGELGQGELRLSCEGWVGVEVAGSPSVQLRDLDIPAHVYFCFNWPRQLINLLQF